MNRKEEAAAEWLTFRGYDKNIQNAEQLKQLLQTIETKLSQTANNSHLRSYFEMDCLLLKYWKNKG
jgi:hypothetical protein